MNFSGRVKHTHPEKFITLELLLSGIFAQKSCKVESKYDLENSALQFLKAGQSPRNCDKLWLKTSQVEGHVIFSQIQYHQQYHSCSCKNRAYTRVFRSCTAI